MSVLSRHLKAERKFVVNHSLTILRGTVAALFSHFYVWRWEIEAVFAG
jgi:hypothetical protein